MFALNTFARHVWPIVIALSLIINEGTSRPLSLAGENATTRQMQ